MYVVAYYIVFAMRNESTPVNSKINSDIAVLFYFAIHDPSIYLFDRHVLHRTYIDIDMYIVYLKISTVRTIWWRSRLQRQSSKREIVGSSTTVVFFIL